MLKEIINYVKKKYKLFSLKIKIKIALLFRKPALKTTRMYDFQQIEISYKQKRKMLVYNQIKNNHMSKSLCLLLLLLAITSCRNLQSSSSGNGAYYSGVYLNAFQSYLGKTSTEINATIEDAFNKIFYWSEVENTTQYRAYYETGTDLAYVANPGGKVWISAMAQAMMVTVQMNRKGQFDKLWNFIKTYLQIGSGLYQGYFARKSNPNGSIILNQPTYGPDQQIATALFFAGKRWGDTTGIYNYTAQAKALLTLFRSQSSAGTYLFDPTTKLINYGLNTNEQTTGRMNSNQPAFYDLWAVFDSQNSAFWTAAATANRAFLSSVVNTATGLTPEKAYFNGTTIGNFVPNCYWTISHIATDQYWWGLSSQSWQIDQANNLQDFFISQGIDTYGSKYTLSGTELNTNHHIALIYNNAVTSLSSTSSGNSQQFLQQLWSIGVPTDGSRGESFPYLLSMLLCSGNYKIYQ